MKMRDFVRGRQLFAAGVIAGFATCPAFAKDYHEAPMLAELVAAGTLPPVTERLPIDPEVVVPFESIGTYGGTIHFGIAGIDDQEQISYFAGNQGLVRYDPTTNYSTVVPNLAVSYDVDAAGQVFTFKLRDGVKWSDGSPLTTDDIAFNIQDFVLNPEWAPTPKGYTLNGTNVKFEVLDKLTVRFSFDLPNGEFLSFLADRKANDQLFYEKAHCSLFHPKYNTTTLPDLLKAANFTDWRDLMEQECGMAGTNPPSRFSNPNRPVLEAWVIKEGYNAGATQVVMERNPYFWMVDSDGNQLPYIDKAVGTIYSDAEALLLGAIGGKLDFQFRELATASNRPVLAANREKGGYDLYEATSIGGSPAVVFLNLTHKDPEYRKLFNTKDFRIALSLGTDRQEIIDTVFLGAGEPWNDAPYEDGAMYYPDYAKQYIQFDPDTANKLLDGIGLDKRDADGIRLLPSGKPLVINTDMSPNYPEMLATLEIMTRQWAKIGVRLQVTSVDRSITMERLLNNDHDMALFEDYSHWLPGKTMNSLVPTVPEARWAIEWVNWYNTNGEKGEEPPESVKERFRLYDQTKNAFTFEARKAIMDKIVKIATDQFEVFAITKQASQYGIKKNGLMNVRPSTPNTSQFPPSLMLPWSWYWAK